MSRGIAAAALAGVALTLVVSACASDGSTAEIEARIQELEEQVATAGTTTTSMAAGTTMAPDTTTSEPSTKTTIDESCVLYGRELQALKRRLDKAVEAGVESYSNIVADDKASSADDADGRTLSQLSTDSLLVAVETKDLGFGVEPAYTEFARRLYIVGIDVSDAMDYVAIAVARQNRYMLADAGADFSMAVDAFIELPVVPPPLALACFD
jgi:hypothetical protein